MAGTGGSADAQPGTTRPTATIPMPPASRAVVSTPGGASTRLWVNWWASPAGPRLGQSTWTLDTSSSGGAATAWPLASDDRSGWLVDHDQAKLRPTLNSVAVPGTW